MDHIGNISAGLGKVSHAANHLRMRHEALREVKGVTCSLDEIADSLDAAVNGILGSIEGLTAEAMIAKKETQHYGHGRTVRGPG